MGMAHHVGKFAIAANKAEIEFKKFPTEENRKTLASAIDRLEDAQSEARMEYEGEY